MTKIKTISKILGTSIVAFAVLALMVPANMTHATLIGDVVDITLLGADSFNNPESPGVDDFIVVGPELDFVWNDAGCGFDDGVIVDIEASTITINVGAGFGASFICNNNGDPIDSPLTFTIESLDWVDNPNGVLDEITVTSNPATLQTTQQVTGDHSVQITIDSIQTQGGIVEFTLEKKIIVDLDLKPQSCPNPVNVLSKGLVPVAILGTAEFDVNDIVISSLPDRTIKHTIEDVAAPFGGPLIDQFSCTEAGPDGFDDLIFKIPSSKLNCLPDGELALLIIDGVLLDGTPFEGSDIALVINKKACP